MRKRERDWAIKNLTELMFRWKRTLKEDIVVIQEVLTMLVFDEHVQKNKARSSRLRKHYGRMRKATKDGL